MLRSQDVAVYIKAMPIPTRCQYISYTLTYPSVIINVPTSRQSNLQDKAGTLTPVNQVSPVLQAPYDIVIKARCYKHNRHTHTYTAHAHDPIS